MARVTRPSVPLDLRRQEEAAREGMYSGEFTAVLAGDYRVELQPPAGTDDELAHVFERSHEQGGYERAMTDAAELLAARAEVSYVPPSWSTRTGRWESACACT